MRVLLFVQIYPVTKNKIMKAAVFHKIGDISVDNVPDPKIEAPDDIILKVTSTAICSRAATILPSR